MTQWLARFKLGRVMLWLACFVRRPRCWRWECQHIRSEFSDMNQILSMLSDGQGNTSSLRVLMFLFALYLLAAHLILLIQTGQRAPFSNDELYLLGLLLGAKVVQNHQENQSGQPPTDEGGTQP